MAWFLCFCFVAYLLVCMLIKVYPVLLMLYSCPIKLLRDVSARLFLKRKLSNLQWMAIILLTVGTTTSQVCYYHETSMFLF
jgi:hypothetical protein